MLFIHDDELVRAVNESISRARLRQPARQQLMDLLQALDSADLLIPLGTAFTMLGVTGGQGAIELIRAMSSRWLRIGPSIVDEYERLIVSRPDDEPAFQQFFGKHPQILDPMAAQVWSQPDFHGVHEPDFIIRRADNSYLIVEIETPGKQIVTRAGQLSAEATHAERQVTDYRAFLNERISDARRHFPYYHDAECLVVIGLEDILVQEQMRSLLNANANRHSVRIVGFDWLARRTRAIIENVSSGDVEVVTRYRMV